ncbi:hypothetical protein OAE93_01660 [bacterium]|nr:hypothetical protein [bacterium]
MSLIATIARGIGVSTGYNGYTITTYHIIPTIVSYIALYFFNAWLVGDEEDSDKEET